MGLKDTHLTEGEKVIVRLRTHVKALIPAVIWLIVLLIAPFLVSRLFRDRQVHDITMTVTWGIVALLILWLVIWPFIAWLTSHFTITNRRVSHRHGVITRKGRDIPLHRINDISSERGLVDRMFGCGTLVVSDATQQQGMILHDVPNVERVRVQLQELLYSYDDGSDDGEWPPNEPPRKNAHSPG